MRRGFLWRPDWLAMGSEKGAGLLMREVQPNTDLGLAADDMSRGSFDRPADTVCQQEDEIP